MSLAAKLSKVNVVVKGSQREINAMPTDPQHRSATDSQQELAGSEACRLARNAVGDTGELAAAR